MSFKDKVVVVTGASSGIGAATAMAFSGKGARVVMVGRNETKLAAVAACCLNPLVIRADVADDSEVRRIVDQTIEKFGQLDILVNNAGVSDSASLLQGDVIKSYDFITSINLRAVIHLTSVATPHLIKAKGSIVNISSIAGTLSSAASMMAYGVSKAGLNHFSQYAAAELAPHGVRVNTVSPGPVRTDIIQNSNGEITWEDFEKITALNRVSEPEEIAELIMFLASEKSKGITGSNFVTDNGTTAIR